MHQMEVKAQLWVVDNWTQLRRAARGDKVDEVPMRRVRREQERSAAREERQLEWDRLPQIQK